jgi:ABC-type transport system involved in multi-copper enzyme maturation permease subunit
MSIIELILSIILICVICLSLASVASSLNDANKANQTATILNKNLIINNHYGITSDTILKNTLAKPDEFFNYFQLQRDEFKQLYNKVFSNPTVFLAFKSVDNSNQLFSLKDYIDTKKNVFPSTVPNIPTPTSNPSSFNPELPKLSPNSSYLDRFEGILSYMIPVEQTVVNIDNTINNIFLVPLDNSINIGRVGHRMLYITTIVLLVFTLLFLLYKFYKTITSGHDEESPYNSI